MSRKHLRDPLSGTIYEGVVEVPEKPPDAVQVDEANRRVKAAAQAKERRDHLLARMAGNIAAGIAGNVKKGEPFRAIAWEAVGIAREILKQIEEGE